MSMVSMIMVRNRSKCPEGELSTGGGAVLLSASEPNSRQHFWEVLSYLHPTSYIRRLVSGHSLARTFAPWIPALPGQRPSRTDVPLFMGTYLMGSVRTGRRCPGRCPGDVRGKGGECPIFVNIVSSESSLTTVIFV